jgi:hypothetical protein
MIVHFGKLYACSRCPGWQTDDGSKAVRHASIHYQQDEANGVCPVCLSTNPRICGHHAQKRSSMTKNHPDTQRNV